jgi:hypothetical protein
MGMRILFFCAFVGCVAVSYGCGSSEHLLFVSKTTPNEEIPQLTWPLPAASATMDLTFALLLNHHGLATFGDVDSILHRALSATGYDTMSYFAAPLGFALVTRVEQIEATGAPKPPPWRWSVEAPTITLSEFSLSGYLRALFTANPGHYRVLIFVVTDSLIKQTEQHVPIEEARLWMYKGVVALPHAIASKPWTATSACVALVYEFVRNDGQQAKVVVPGSIEGSVHLRPMLRAEFGR